MGFDGSVNSTLRKKINDEFTYYFFDKDEKLVGIGRATFDKDIAD